MREAYKIMDCIMQRIVNLWNSLPLDSFDSKSLSGFKKGIDDYMANENNQNYIKQDRNMWVKNILMLQGISQLLPA